MLKAKALALSFAIVWGAGMLLLGWIAAFGWGVEAVEVLSSFYIGFKATFWGGVIGAIWGFIDGFIGGFFIAFFYNLFAKKEKK